MPCISALGKVSPASISTSSPSASNTVMFLPTSPSPPSGMIFTASRMLTRPQSQQAGSSRVACDGCGLLLVGLDQRQPHAAHVMAEQVQRRLQRIGLVVTASAS